MTGASRGIGRAIALRLGEHGASVVVNYWQSAHRAREVVEAVEAMGSRAVAVKADVRQVDHVQTLVRESVHRFTRLHILVNTVSPGGVDTDVFRRMRPMRSVKQRRLFRWVGWGCRRTSPTSSRSLQARLPVG